MRLCRVKLEQNDVAIGKMLLSGSKCIYTLKRPAAMVPESSFVMVTGTCTTSPDVTRGSYNKEEEDEEEEEEFFIKLYLPTDWSQGTQSSELLEPKVRKSSLTTVPLTSFGGLAST
jgi:hypothetical protein